MIAPARATAGRVGVNTSLMIGTCAGWIAILPVNPSAARLFRLAPQSGFVAKINVHRVDRLYPRGDRSHQTEGAGEPIGFKKISVGVAIGFSPEISREVLGAPGEPRKARARVAIGAEPKQRTSAFSAEGEDLDMAVCETMHGFATDGQLGAEVEHARRTVCFRQQDGVRPRRHHGLEVRVG